VIAAPPVAAAALSVEALTITREGLDLIHDVKLHVAAGETLAVAGPNGGGKTTLLLAAAGFLKASRGRIEVAGVTPTAAASRGMLGFVPQHDRPAGPLPVTPRQVLDLAGTGPRAWLDELRELALRDVDCDRPIHRLSGGQRQLVRLARAVAHRPRVLLLDEPTLGLSPAAVAGLVRVVKRCGEAFGCATVVATHDHHAAMRLSGRLLYLDRTVRYDGPADAVPADLDRCLCHHE